MLSVLWLTEGGWLWWGGVEAEVSMKVLVVMRGLFGSGKTTAAEVLLKHLGNGAVRLCVDDKFGIGDDYRFESEKLGKFVEEVFADASKAFSRGVPVILDSSNVQRWGYERYVKAARLHGYTVVQCNMGNGGLSAYQLSLRSLRAENASMVLAQKREWEHDAELDDIGAYAKTLVKGSMGLKLALTESAMGYDE